VSFATAITRPCLSVTVPVVPFSKTVLQPSRSKVGIEMSDFFKSPFLGNEAVLHVPEFLYLGHSWLSSPWSMMWNHQSWCCWECLHVGVDERSILSPKLHRKRHIGDFHLLIDLVQNLFFHLPPICHRNYNQCRRRQ
jgi:hypothetical protein